MKVGIVGCGVIGKQHIKAAQEAPWIELAGVTDAFSETARQAADQFGIHGIYDDASALFADPAIDAVVLAVPTAEWVIVRTWGLG